MHRIVVCGILIFASCQLIAQTATSPSNSGHQGTWKVLYEETFENPSALFPGHPPTWVADTYQGLDEYSDGGEHFRQLGITPPTAYRAEAPFSTNGWLSVAAYSRSSSTPFADLFQVVVDPANPANHVLKISSPRYTDGIVIRSTTQLPPRYRVCVRVGYASFGDGKPGAANLNGYAGRESDGPWLSGDATLENGFYSDNNKEAWTNIWEGSKWVADGQPGTRPASSATTPTLSLVSPATSSGADSRPMPAPSRLHPSIRLRMESRTFSCSEILTITTTAVSSITMISASNPWQDR